MDGLTWSTVVPIALALGLGAAVQSAVGFGAAVVAAPLVALVDVRLLPAVLTPAGLVTNVAVLRRDGTGVHRPTVGILLAAAAVGTVLAFPLLRVEEEVRQVLVAVVAATGAIGLSLRLRPTRPRAAVGGILSGVGGLLAGISGPQVLPVVPRDDLAQFRGTLAAYFLATTPLVLVALVLADQPVALALTTGALALPVVAVGIALGHVVAARARPTHLRAAVLVLAVLAATGPIVDAAR